MLKILVVDDDPMLRWTVKQSLEKVGHKIEEAHDGQAAAEKVEARPGYFDAVLLDVNMPRLSGIDALARIKEADPKVFCVVMTAYTDHKDAVAAIRLGAFDYLEKPVDSKLLIEILDHATQARELVEDAGLSAPSLEFPDGRNMIGQSEPIKKVFEMIYKLSKVDTAVMIRGESGTGKELVARALHCNSFRKKGPFIAVNCAAIPENLIESELFGHEKGSFTGADKKKDGRFQAAAGGTLFLDEIGDMTQQMQVKLLRVLQEKTFTPVGSNKDQSADVRIIAATSRNLEEMMTKDQFRSDLFYRLNILPVKLPALRERREDIPSLVTHMISRFNKVHRKSLSGFDAAAMDCLQSYSWPGNIRELENVVEHAFIVTDGSSLRKEALPEHVVLFKNGASGRDKPLREYLSPIIDFDSEDTQRSAPSKQNLSSELEAELNFPVMKERFERDFICKALEFHRGRINQTAIHTQMTKVTLLRKLEKYGINPKEFY